MIKIGENNSYVLVEFRCVPIPVNHCYRIVTRGGVTGAKSFMALDKAAHDFKELVAEKMEDAALVIPANWEFLRVEYLFIFEKSGMMTKGKKCINSLHPIDVSNMFKLLEDSIHEHIGVDDRYVVSISGHKRFVPDGSFTNLWACPVNHGKYKSKAGLTLVRIEGLHPDLLPLSDNLKRRFGFDYFEAESEGGTQNV